MPHKIDSYFWVKTELEIESMTTSIKKDLEFNYRLPENLISLLLRHLKKIFNSQGVNFFNDQLIILGVEIEEILKKYEESLKELTVLELNKIIESFLLKIETLSEEKIEQCCLSLKGIIEDYITINEIKYHDKVKIGNKLINPESHFENGYFLHSTQYYFAKSYFQNSENCDKLSILLANKLEQLKLKKVTLVGFRSYSGLLLNKTKRLLGLSGLKIDYVILEQMEGDDFTWQFIPDFEKINTNFLIVLPITCTCSTYIRIRKYLKSQIDNYLSIEFPKSKRRVKDPWRVRRDFINIFLIQDSRLDGVTESVIVNKDTLALLAIEKNRVTSDIEKELSLLYSDFNWDVVKNDSIHFRNDQYQENAYIAHPIVKLYSDLRLPEQCIFCFPKNDLTAEKNIFLTHDNFETPNLIQDFPNFGKERPQKDLLKCQQNHAKRSDLTFTKLFQTDNLKRASHYYGHIKVNRSNYLNYIRGNTFFNQNKDLILEFFNSVLNEILLKGEPKLIKNVVFITAQNKHNSTFLSEITSYNSKGQSSTLSTWQNDAIKNNNDCQINILSIDSENEFIDNFMSNYIDLLNIKNTLIIYFEEVFSAGKTFKLLSNYLKHYKNINHEEKELRHGFDYVFSLIDRTPYHTREEILKKLYSKDFKTTVNRFVSFFKLNVPIIEAAHLGNPLTESLNLHIQMVKESHLDVLRNRIGKELLTKTGRKLPEETTETERRQELKYFPFGNDLSEISFNQYKKYKDFLKNANGELLKLYVAHKINVILANNKKDGDEKSKLEKLAESGELVSFIVDTTAQGIQDERERFFYHDINESDYILDNNEIVLVHDTVLKILSRHPFTYYNKLYKAVFKYCIKKIDLLRLEILNTSGIPSFFQIRQLKFYVRRLVDLDSSYLISGKFLELLKHLCEFRLANGKNRIESLQAIIMLELNAKIDSNLVAPWQELILNLKSQITVPNPEEILGKLKYYISRLMLYKPKELNSYSIRLIKDKFEIKLEDSENELKKLLSEIESKIQNSETRKRNIKEESVDEKENFPFIDVILNNLVYKYNSVTSFSGLILYSFKESIFKNHYRSIKLEGLINSQQLLPKVIIDPNVASNSLQTQIKDPYYLLTGQIKFENLFLINRLKELHKEKYQLYVKRATQISNEIGFDKLNAKNKNLLNLDLEKKWMDPLSTDSIVNYYFQSWKSDPVIISANKFILNSRFADENGMDFPCIKRAVANMLKSATLLMSEHDKDENFDIIADIHEILKGIVSIIQPGIEEANCLIGSQKSKLGYALCIKYSADSKTNTENIFIVSSDKSTNGCLLNPEGLVYNLMNGLYSTTGIKYTDNSISENSNATTNGDQTVLVGMKIGDIWSSVNDKYFVNTDFDSENRELGSEVSFGKMLELDCKVGDGKFGLPILSNSKMNLFFRLSELEDERLTLGDCKLKGKAVLIVTCDLEVNKLNFLKFMSNEKVRLLLLLRDEFLTFINEITANSAFHQLIKREELLSYQSALRHGLEDYFGYQQKIIESSNFTTRNIIILKSINDAIKGQISAYDVLKNVKNKNFEKKEVVARITNILESSLIVGKAISKGNYQINLGNNGLFVFDSFIFEIVILELIINAKRHSPNVGAGIIINFGHNSFEITNSVKTTSSSDNERHKQGLVLCDGICKILDYTLETDSLSPLTFTAKISKKINYDQSSNN